MRQALILTAAFAAGLAIGLEASEPPAEPTAVHDTVYMDSPLTEWEVLTLALIEVESDYDSTAVGKKQDLGILQLTPIYCAEVERLTKMDYPHSLAKSPRRSLEMFEAYNLSKNPTKSIERAIKLHNPTAGEWYSKRVLLCAEKIKQREQVREYVKQQNRK